MATEKKEIVPDTADIAPAPDYSTAPAPDDSTTPAIPTAPVPAGNPDTFVRFSKPYFFEGMNYTGVNLDGMDRITARDMIDAEKYLVKCGVVTPLPEMAMEYIGFIGNLISGQPIEFFKGLPPRDAIKVKNKITGFFYGED